MNKTDNEYKQWLIDLKKRIRQGQIKAAIRVNTELLHLYWDLGHDIVARQMEAVWGSGFFEQLSKDLMIEFPDMKGFSSTNLKYCKRFYLFYTQDDATRQQVADTIRHQLGDEIQLAENKKVTIRPQLVDELDNHPVFQIPWRHHVEIITKCKSVHEALFYVQKTTKNGWSRAVLMNFLEADLYSAQGKSRSDGTLLTVGFNLRTRNALRSPQSPAGTTLWRDKVSSLRDFEGSIFRLIRRLKSTVNKVPSLRDFTLSLRDFAPSLAERGVGG